MRLSDMPALRKMDYAYHAPFLTACTAALTAHGYLSASESEQLRVQLKERHRTGEGEALFQQLRLDKNAAFHVLEARLGPYNFNNLLFRWTIAKALESFNYSIWSFAQELLNKAELMFNQSFWLYSGKICMQRRPFSYFLVETAAEIHKNADELHAYVRELKRWSLRKKNQAAFEFTLAEHLGFATDQDSGLSEWQLHELLRKAWLQLELLGEFNAHVLRQMSVNLKMEGEEPRLKFLLEDFQSLLLSSKGSAPIDFSSPEVMEAKRLRMLSVMQECKDITFEYYQVLLESIKTSRIPSVAHNIWPEQESRAIVNHLLDRGITISDAQQALTALIAYCHDHSVSPEQLLEAELQRIHPFLDRSSSLFLRKASTTDRLSESFNEEKHHIVEKKDHLMHSINHRLLGLAIVCFVLFNFGSSCGVKTAPRSDVLDVKPTVPYHAEQRAFPKKNSEEPLASPPK